MLSSAPLGVDDQYEASQDRPLVISSTAVRPEAADFPDLLPAQSIWLNSSITKLQVAPSYELLFALDNQGRVHVVDSAIGQESSLFVAESAISDLDVTADGRYVYAVSPLPGPYPAKARVHRFDSETGQWETRTSTIAGNQIEAVDADRFVVAQRGYYTLDLALGSWDTGQPGQVVTLSGSSMSPCYDVIYDDATGRLYANAAEGHPGEIVQVKQIMGNAFVAKESVTHPGPIASLIQTLSTDGTHYYYDRVQIDALNVSHKIREFPEPILGETRGIAFSAKQYYSAETGELLGNFTSSNTAYAASSLTRQIWAARGGSLDRYDLPTSRVGGVLLNDTDADQDLASAVLEQAPQHGAFEFAADGTFQYSPEAGFFGFDSFTYRAVDLAGNLGAPATVAIVVHPADSAPIATNDLYFVPIGKSFRFGTEPLTLANTLPRKLMDEFATGYHVTQMAYVAHENILFVREGTTSVHVIDVANKQTISTLRAQNAFTRFDVSPDGNTLYLAENPLNPPSGAVGVVWRYDVAANEWSSKPLDGVANQLEAIDGNRFLSFGGNVPLTVNGWGLAGEPIEVIASAPNSKLGYDVKFDPHTSRVYFAISSAKKLLVYQLTDDSLVEKASFSTKDRTIGPLFLLPNGSKLMYGDMAFDLRSANLTMGTNWNPKIQEAANDFLVFTDGKVYGNGWLNDLYFTAGSIHASADGGYLWAYDSDHKSLKQFDIRGVRQSVLRNDFDVDRDQLTAALVSGPRHGTLTFHANGTFDYTPDAGYAGLDEFTYQVTAFGQSSEVATVSLLVVAQPPTPSSLTYPILEDTTLVIDQAHGLLATVNAPNLPELRVELVTAPTAGDLTLHSDGSFTFVPVPNADKPDKFVYRVTNGLAYSEEMVATIQITPIPDPPTTQDDAYSVNEDGRLSNYDVGNIRKHARDPDSTLLELVMVSYPAHGTLEIGKYGDFVYRPHLNFVGDDPFVYYVTDGVSNSAPATVTFHVLPVNDAPVGIADSYTFEESLTVSAASGVLANDLDVEGDSLSATIIGGPYSGSVTLNADGSFIYQPRADRPQFDEFTYSVSDGKGGSAVGKVSLKPSLFINTENLAELRTSETGEVSALFAIGLSNNLAEPRLVSSFQVALRLPPDRGTRFIGIEPHWLQTLVPYELLSSELRADGTLIVSATFPSPVYLLNFNRLFTVRFAAASEARAHAAYVDLENTWVIGGSGDSYYLTRVQLGNLNIIDRVRPKLLDVSVKAQNWTPEFLAMLTNAGLGNASYRVSPSETLPWQNISEIKLQFDEPVNVRHNVAQLLGMNGTKYYVSVFRRNNEPSNTLNVGISYPTQRDVLDLILDTSAYGITDTSGNKLYNPDGWQAKTLSFSFKILVGDINQSGFVNAADFVPARQTLTQPWLYRPQMDINGSGTVDQADVDAIWQKMGTILPRTPVQPQPQTNAAISGTSPELVAEPMHVIAPSQQAALLPEENEQFQVRLFTNDDEDKKQGRFKALRLYFAAAQPDIVDSVLSDWTA